jgi:hypothetical protein
LQKLIVTNGDSGAERIRAAKIAADILVWSDMLHEGPVPETPNTAALTAIRAQFLSTIAGNDRKPAAELFQRDRVIAGAGMYKEVVLWFEHDLFDQLQLLQVLDFLGQRNFKDTKVSIIISDQYVGRLEPDEAIALFASRKPVEEEHYDLASLAWAAFRAPNPQALVPLLDEAKTKALPFLSKALRRLLEEFPHENGLSRSQYQILRTLKEQGSQPARALYRMSHHKLEDAIWLGDWAFALRLMEISGMPYAPIVLKETGDGSVPDSDAERKPHAVPTEEETRTPEPIERTLDSLVELTPFGEKLLLDEEDLIKRNGIDRWIGGTHLQPGQIWRWSSSEQTVLPE